MAARRRAGRAYGRGDHARLRRCSQRGAATDHWGGAPQATYWVSSSGTSGAADTSCRTAGYSAIQTAVNAAGGAPPGQYGVPARTIEICPGTYTEQVTITKSMTLTRAAGRPYGGPATIELPATIAESKTNCQAKDNGTGRRPSSRSARPGRTAITPPAPRSPSATSPSRATGGPSQLQRQPVRHLRRRRGQPVPDRLHRREGRAGHPAERRLPGDYGVEVGWALSSQVGHAGITNDTIESYQKNGITVDGPGSTADIDHDVDRIRADAHHRAERHPDLVRCHRAGHG